MKIVFMGTPQFSVPILEEISKENEIILVVTQPDTFNIKKKEYIPSPVKTWALAHQIDVFQPEKIRTDYKRIIDLDVDLIVTAAYGQFIGDEVLNHPKYNSINVHGSILPKYRGGAPIQKAIINGEKETGITIMYMAKKMDAGDIIRIEKTPILDSDTQDSLFLKLSLLGSKMINSVIKEIEENKAPRIPQDESMVSFAYNLTKEDELIDFTKTSLQVFNQIRGLNSNPGAYFILDNQNVKVYNSKVSTETHQTKPGVIVGIKKDSIDISCSNHTVISITEIKLPSKQKMLVRDYLNGQGKKLRLGQEVNCGE